MASLPPGKFRDLLLSVDREYSSFQTGQVSVTAETAAAMVAAPKKTVKTPFTAATNTPTTLQPSKRALYPLYVG